MQCIHASAEQGGGAQPRCGFWDVEDRERGANLLSSKHPELVDQLRSVLALADNLEKDARVGYLRN